MSVVCFLPSVICFLFILSSANSDVSLRANAVSVAISYLRLLRLWLAMTRESMFSHFFFCLLSSAPKAVNKINSTLWASPLLVSPLYQWRTRGDILQSVFCFLISDLLFIFLWEYILPLKIFLRAMKLIQF